MKILVVGSGGREHALCWKIQQSPLVKEMYAAPGNPGIAEIAEILPIEIDDCDGICRAAQNLSIDLVVVGPELPLSLGIVDRLTALGIPACGPSGAAAQIEASKAFAKEIMQAAGVPTAKSGTFTDEMSARRYLQENHAPIVLKADGLAAGKGVYVCMTEAELEPALQDLFSVQGARVVIEQFLPGKEASFICLCRGQEVLALAPSHDYKRIFDGHKGANTGGMGTVSPTPHLSDAQAEWAIDHVIKPTLRALDEKGILFSGFLYAGLMIAESGEIHVLEFNARLGDPETQVILRRMKSDILPALLWSAGAKTEKPELEWLPETALCVVMASAGYPQSSRKGDVISGITEFNAKEPDGIVFHAGTARQSDGKLVTAGGRVLNVTATGSSIEDARAKVYSALPSIQFPGSQFRSDIGH